MEAVVKHGQSQSEERRRNERPTPILEAHLTARLAALL
jgi:hypothetical protein